MHRLSEQPGFDFRHADMVIRRWEQVSISIEGHGDAGSGLMTGSLTGLELFHNKFDLPLAQVIHTEAPYYFRRADAAVESLSARSNYDGGLLPIGAPS